MGSTAALATAHRLKGALGVLDCNIELEAGESGVALVFRHPRLQRQVVIEVGGGDEHLTVGVYLLLDVWQDVLDKPGEAERLLACNDRMMSAAVAILPLMDTPVVALMRRVPADDLAAEDAADLLDAMAWEFTAASRQTPPTEPS